MARSRREDDRLEHIREQLGEDERRLLLLRYRRALDWSAMAAALSAEGDAVSPSAVRRRFGRLRQRIERLARAEGLLAR
jgi:RNA polymerase sigma-70 factor (ECF subfamily)